MIYAYTLMNYRKRVEVIDLTTISTSSTPLVSVTVQQVSNGFIVTQQTMGQPFIAPIQQVFNDFPDTIAALATIFGVPAITAASLNATITAAAATTAAPSTTSAPASS
jgi:hypothetical protein